MEYSETILQCRFEAIRNLLTNRDPYARQLGIVIEEVDVGFSRAVMPFDERHTNSKGELHHSAVYTLADMVFGGVLLQDGYIGVTLASQINYIARAGAGPITADARRVTAHESIDVIRVDIRDGEQRLIATATTTGYKLDSKLPV